MNRTKKNTVLTDGGEEVIVSEGAGEEEDVDQEPAESHEACTVYKQRNSS